MARGIDLVLGVSKIFLLGAVIYDRFAPIPDICTGTGESRDPS